MTTENTPTENVNSEEQKPAASISKNGKIVASVALSAVIAGAFSVSSTFDAKAEKKVAEFVESVNAESDGQMNIAYGDVAAFIGSSTLSVSDVVVSGEDGQDSVSINSVDIQAKGYVEDQQLPYLANISIDGLEVLEEEALKQMSDSMGVDYSGRDIDAFFGYEIDESKDLMSASAQWSVSGLSDVSFSAEMSSVNDAWTEIQAAYKESEGSMDVSFEQKQKIKRNLQSVMVNSLAVTYKNDGEYDAMIATVVKNNGITEEQVKTQLVTSVDQFLGKTAQAEAIKGFIANPETITVTVTPNVPMTFGELPMMMMSAMMGQADQVMKTLNVQVQSN